MQGSRAECALARSIRKLNDLYFYDFRRRIVDALNIVSLCTLITWLCTVEVAPDILIRTTSLRLSDQYQV